MNYAASPLQSTPGAFSGRIQRWSVQGPGLCRKGNDLRAGLELIQVVGPKLHQLPSFRQVFGIVIGEFDFIATPCGTFRFRSLLFENGLDCFREFALKEYPGSRGPSFLLFHIPCALKLPAWIRRTCGARCCFRMMFSSR